MNEEQISGIKNAGPEATYEHKARKPMFHSVLFNGGLPEPEKTIQRLGAEASLVVIAGSDTVGNALTQLHYQFLANPEKLTKLRGELHDFDPNLHSAGGPMPKWQDLRKLPYLTACIEEILRLANTVTHRLARFAPIEGLRYKDYYLPAGVSPCLVP